MACRIPLVVRQVAIGAHSFHLAQPVLLQCCDEFTFWLFADRPVIYLCIALDGRFFSLGAHVFFLSQVPHRPYILSSYLSNSMPTASAAACNSSPGKRISSGICGGVVFRCTQHIQ